MTAYHVLGVAGATTGQSTSASQTTGATQSTGGSANSRGGMNPALFFCSGLFGTNSSVLDGVLSVAPLTTRAADAKSDIQFGHIWSETHQATVGQHRDPLTKPLVADVKLPIAFSAADRKRFEAAGWKPRSGGISGATSYCLESGQSPGAEAAASTRGLFCVTGTP